jgi:hypothetical protein
VLELLACWALFPLVLLVLSLGAGLTLEAAAGDRLPGALLVPAGFATLVVVAGLTTLTSATAPLTTPALVALAVAGFALTARRTPPRPQAPVAALAAFVCVGSPVLLSGTATFAGYVKLDDTATFLALGDRVLEHGRSLGGLAPSSYEATVDAFLGGGYPIGSLLPWAVGHQLTGQDLAWVYAPYLAWLAALLALAVFALLEPVVASAWGRAAAAAIAAQPALLFGFAQWGGVKELYAAALLPLVAALAARAGTPRTAVPAALAAAALLGALTLGGVVWLPLVLAPALWAARSWRVPATLVAATAGFALPTLATASSILGAGSRATLQSETELGNLVRPLRAVQALGVWPAGDFRTDAGPDVVVGLLLAAVALGAALGVAVAWRARAWALLGYLGAAGLGAALLGVLGSPWVAGKGFATAAPAFVAAALAGAAAPAQRRRMALGTGMAVLVAGGVVWSNALQYRDAWLAPRDQLAELERIGQDFAGRGPALMTEYQPYGVRHFLRALDAEGASELRRRPVPLRDGGVAEKGAFVDLDGLAPAALAPYRLLVLRRSPAESRPPASFALARRGRFYDVWRRDGATSPRSPLALGDAVQPGAVPRCADVRRLARGGPLVAAPRAANVVAALGAGTAADGLRADALGYVRGTSGVASVSVAVPRDGTWRAWVGGSVRGRLRLWVDGRAVGEVERRLNPAGQYLELGLATLAAGPHTVAVRLDRPVLRPGVGGPADALGPLVLEPAAPQRLLTVAPDDARSLCGRRLDWVASAAS